MKQLDCIRKVFRSMVVCIGHALESSMNTIFGAREEYRISWNLFMEVEPLNQIFNS